MPTDRPLRILLCGSHEVGKTAIVDALRGIEGIAVSEEASIDYINKIKGFGLEIGKRIVYEPRYQGMLFRAQKRREAMAMKQKGAEVVICDRSVIDNLAYIFGLRDLYRARAIPGREDYSEPDPNKVYHIENDWLDYIAAEENQFDAIFLCNPGDINPDISKLEAEAWTEDYIAGRIAIHNKFYDVAEYLRNDKRNVNINLIDLAGDPFERVATVVDFINQRTNMGLIIKPELREDELRSAIVMRETHFSPEMK